MHVLLCTHPNILSCWSSYPLSPFSWRFLRHECDQNKLHVYLGINFDSNPRIHSQDRADVSIPQQWRPCFASSGSANRPAAGIQWTVGRLLGLAHIKTAIFSVCQMRLLLPWLLHLPLGMQFPEASGSSSKYTGTCHKPKSARWNFSMVNK